MTLPTLPPFPVLPDEFQHRFLWKKWAEDYGRVCAMAERERAVQIAEAAAYDGCHQWRRSALEEVVKLLERIDRNPENMSADTQLRGDVRAFLSRGKS
jgi:hypothetical protein